MPKLVISLISLSNKIFITYNSTFKYWLISSQGTNASQCHHFFISTSEKNPILTQQFLSKHKSLNLEQHITQLQNSCTASAKEPNMSFNRVCEIWDCCVLEIGPFPQIIQSLLSLCKCYNTLCHSFQKRWYFLGLECQIDILLWQLETKGGTNYKPTRSSQAVIIWQYCSTALSEEA